MYVPGCRLSIALRRAELRTTSAKPQSKRRTWGAPRCVAALKGCDAPKRTQGRALPRWLEPPRRAKAAARVSRGIISIPEAPILACEQPGGSRRTLLGVVAFLEYAYSGYRLHSLPHHWYVVEMRQGLGSRASIYGPYFSSGPYNSSASCEAARKGGWNSRLFIHLCRELPDVDAERLRVHGPTL